MAGLLIIVRHGESEWNATGQWTGTTNVHLTEKGRSEGQLMGKELSDLHFDYAYVSEQVRTSETLEEMMKTHPQKSVAHEVTAAFNERDYGIYTGQNKWDVQQKVGETTFNKLRREWDYPVEGGESLKTVYERAVPFYQEVVIPRLLKGENVLIVAHGNSIRSLVKYIESVADQDIAKIEMIFGTALIYQVDEQGKVMSKNVRNIHAVLPPA